MPVATWRTHHLESDNEKRVLRSGRPERGSVPSVEYGVAVLRALRRGIDARLNKSAVAEVPVTDGGLSAVHALINTSSAIKPRLDLLITPPLVEYGDPDTEWSAFQRPAATSAFFVDGTLYLYNAFADRDGIRDAATLSHSRQGVKRQ
jgi:hypothetical protein